MSKEIYKSLGEIAETGKKQYKETKSHKDANVALKALLGQIQMNDQEIKKVRTSVMVDKHNLKHNRSVDAKFDNLED